MDDTGVISEQEAQVNKSGLLYSFILGAQHANRQFRLAIQSDWSGPVQALWELSRGQGFRGEAGASSAGRWGRAMPRRVIQNCDRNFPLRPR